MPDSLPRSNSLVNFKTASPDDVTRTSEQTPLPEDTKEALERGAKLPLPHNDRLRFGVHSYTRWVRRWLYKGDANLARRMYVVTQKLLTVYTSRGETLRHQLSRIGNTFA